MQFLPSPVLRECSVRKLPPQTLLFQFSGKEIAVIPQGDSFRIPTRADLPEDADSPCWEVGRIKDIPCAGIPGSDLPPGWICKQIRLLFVTQSAELCYAACRAKNLMFWRKRQQFCGMCGTALNDSPADIARVCPKCGERYYPQIAPAVITAVLRDGKILLAHNKNFRPGMYGLIAGFVEAGENLEQAVAREIMEETSIRVKNIRYHASQTWPFPNSLMLGFVADYESGEAVPDGQELDSAGWFSVKDLPLCPDPGSIAARIIEDFRSGKLV